MEHRIHGMELIDLFGHSQDEIKALKKFKNMDKMSVEEMKTEFWEIQDKFDNMTIDEAESFDGEVMNSRQSFLNNRVEELTGKFIL